MCALAVLVAITSYRYLVPSWRHTLHKSVVANPYARPFLYVHVLSAATALLLGLPQFIRSVRRRHLRLHRLSGRLYVLCCLVGGASAMPIAVHATGGATPQSGFLVLSLLWLAATCNAWRLAAQGRISEHKRWMVRSYALTFFTVTFKLTVAGLPYLGVHVLTAYKAGTWACWLLNLLVVEVWMWNHRTAATTVDVKSLLAEEVAATAQEVVAMHALKAGDAERSFRDATRKS